MRPTQRPLQITLLVAGALAMGGLLGPLVMPGSAFAQAKEPRVVELNITARQWAFEPGIVEVTQGDRVRLKLMSIDVVHGFYLDGYGLDAKLLAGHPVTLEFVADKAGRWAFRCSENCGSFHPYMIGWLRVKPNWYARSALIGVAILSAGSIGLLLYKAVKA